MAKDILLDDDEDLLFKNGDLLIDESELQEVALILQSHQGNWKENAIVGANLTKEIRGLSRNLKYERNIRVQMRLDGKSYEQIKNRIKLKL
ncbi:hypothetical protein [Mesonia sp.]|uniref:hypothetical protein n=1 Tax=Mesonia sp. TaxID=1960830 RepID=UPI0017597966|nr:hypothetical protein [Mesonia sp.]HIB37986.1 hypothetical protein [Mesonia sp.]